MGAVRGLVLSGGVPPRVRVHHHGGAREVEAGAARLERYQEHGRVVLVERVHQLDAAPLGRGARQHEVGDAACVQALRNEVKVACELREHEHLCLGVHHALHEREDRVQLCRGPVVAVVHQAGVAAQLAQAHELREHLQLAAGELLVGLRRKREAQRLLVRAVQLALVAGKLRIHHLLQLVGQVAQNVALQAAQHERTYGRAQPVGAVRVAREDGVLVPLAKAVVAAQEPRHEVVEYAPELGQAVFDGGAREREAVPRRDGLHRTGGKRLVVLYVLRLVQDLAPEVHGGVSLYVAAQQVVAGNEHLVAALATDAGALRRRAHHGRHVHLGCELLELRHPVVHQGGRAHHEARPPAAVCEQEGYHLHGLAQAHLVREDAAKAHGRKRAQPLEAGALVRAQLGRDGRGRLEALGVHGAKSVHVRAERLVLLLVRHDAVEQEGLVAGNAHLAGRKVARGEAKLLRQGGRLRKVRAGKVHKRAVAQPVEAPVAAVARKQAKQLVQRQVVRGDPQVDEVRPHGEPHLHPGRLAAQHPVERVRHVDGARLAKAVHAVQQQPRDGGGVLLAYGRHRAARSRQPEVLLRQLARPGLPRGVARVVRHGVRVAPEHGQAARAVAGLRAARHALARVVQVEVQPQGLRHLVQHLLRRVHVHGLAHAGQDRGRKARHVALAQKHARRVAGIHAREERRHVQQPLGAAKERIARQRVQVARRREELSLALALQVKRTVARLLYAKSHLGVAVRNGHVARRLLHALRHHLDLERAANVQR